MFLGLSYLRLFMYGSVIVAIAAFYGHYEYLKSDRESLKSSLQMERTTKKLLQGAMSIDSETAKFKDTELEIIRAKKNEQGSDALVAPILVDTAWRVWGKVPPN